jgi:choline dehydrogenase-like flavoprotein
MAADSHRGSDGPLTTRWSRYPDPLSGAFVDAGIASGFPATDDYNGAQQEGFGRWQATIRDGRRCSAAVAYLRPALVRPGLAVVTDALVTRIVLDGRRATGIEYLQRGQRVAAYAEREVILAAGVINSPQLLMLSGIGDPAELRSHGIAVAAPLKGVGRNLQDHISAGIMWRPRCGRAASWHAAVPARCGGCPANTVDGVESVHAGAIGIVAGQGVEDFGRHTPYAFRPRLHDAADIALAFGDDVEERLAVKAQRHCPPSSALDRPAEFLQLEQVRN